MDNSQFSISNTHKTLRLTYKRIFMRVMTKNFYILPLLLMTFFITTISLGKAESVTEAKDYALLISNPRHVKGVLKMLDSMRNDKTQLQYRKARVVLYGDAIHMAKKGSEITSLIKESKEHNVTVAVCNQALTRLKVPTSDLLNTVEVVGNAYYEMLRLKTLGYISLDL